MGIQCAKAIQVPCECNGARIYGCRIQQNIADGMIRRPASIKGLCLIFVSGVTFLTLSAVSHFRRCRSLNKLATHTSAAIDTKVL
jgi:hypothetical protein